MTDSISSPLAGHPTRFVLMHTSHPGNVGAAARAMKVMGFSDLVLVAPRFDDVLSREETLAMASGATDVLSGARVVGSLTEALEGVHYACATAMTPRDFGPPTHAPREHFQVLAQQAGLGLRVAMVFGGERFGMANEDVYRCHACLSIPTAPDFGSLNLAQALQVIAYEWRQALGGFGVAARTPEPVWADGRQVQGALDHWETVLLGTGFLDPAAPRKLLPRLHQLANRGLLTQEEIHILRGIARSVQKLLPPGAAKEP